MRSPCCYSFLAFILKFLNFVQSFIGVSIIVYSVYMLNQWNTRSLNPPPDAFLATSIKLLSHALPAPWFIYAFMGLGIVLCCITCVGHIAAEAINGCCLCFYTLLITLLVILEVTLVAFIALDRHWEKALPFDPTGELNSLRGFIEANADVCKWVGIVVVIIQALSLLLGIILRAMVSTPGIEHDVEGDYDVRNRRSEPLLLPQLTQGNGVGVHSDIWRSRLREKYGLNGGDGKYNLVNQNTSAGVK